MTNIMDKHIPDQFSNQRMIYSRLRKLTNPRKPYLSALLALISASSKIAHRPPLVSSQVQATSPVRNFFCFPLQNPPNATLLTPINMHSDLTRLQNVFGFFTTVAFFVGALTALSVFFHPGNPSAEVSLSNVQV